MAIAKSLTRSSNHTHTFVVVFVLVLGLALESGAAECGDWLPFNENELCFKLFNNPVMTFDEATEFCRTQTLSNFNPGLAIVKRREIQEFLAQLLFENEEIFDNVWLGSKFNEERGEFEWWDGSPLTTYDNWAPGYPRDMDDPDRCVEIRSPNSKLGKLEGGGAQWYDVPCRRSNLVVCQKQPSWGLDELVSEFIELRKEVIELRKQIVPVGFIYTQLPGQAEPTMIWPSVRWQVISQEYAGLFLRTEGGGAQGFDGSVQPGNSPAGGISRVETSKNGCHSQGVDVGNGWSNWIWIGDDSMGWDCVNMRFHGVGASGGGEVRPVNTAVRLWKRIA